MQTTAGSPLRRCERQIHKVIFTLLESIHSAHIHQNRDELRFPPLARFAWKMYMRARHSRDEVQRRSFDPFLDLHNDEDELLRIEFFREITSISNKDDVDDGLIVNALQSPSTEPAHLEKVG